MPARIVKLSCGKKWLDKQMETHLGLHLLGYYGSYLARILPYLKCLHNYIGNIL